MAAKKKVAAPKAVSTPAPVAKSDASEKKVVKKAEKKDSLDSAWGAIRFLLKQAEKHWGVDIDNDGKVGSVKVGLLGAIASICLIAGIAWGAAGDVQVYYDSDATWGTAKFVSDQAGTITLTVDAIAAAVTGDITTDDINMSGAVTDSLGFNDTKAASVTGLAATVTFADMGGLGLDTDYVQYQLLTMNNDVTQSIDWAYMNVVIDDNTTNTEDSAVELYVNVDGVETKSLDVDASGVTVPVALTVTGAADLNANSTATNITMDAGSTLAAKAVTCTTLAASGAVDLNANSTATNVTFDAGSTVYVQDLKLGLTQAAAAETNTMTNSPDVNNNASPKWFKVTDSTGNIYLVPGWEFND